MKRNAPKKGQVAAAATTETTGKVHSRTFHMPVTAKGGALVNFKQIPVFTRKKLGAKVAEKVKGKMVPVTLTWPS